MFFAEMKERDSELAEVRRIAFVAGASWWQFHKNGATMFPAEKDEAEQEAEKRYGEGNDERIC